LSSLEKSGNYNFEYAAMVRSKNSVANSWMVSRYNSYWVPTNYWDGGDYVLVGGYSDTAVYAYRIRNAGSREVPDLDLDVSMTWLGDYQMEVTVTVTNNNFINSSPTGPDAPTGPTAALMGEETFYDFIAVDPDNDSVLFRINWGDEIGDWIGPYASGETIQTGHIWQALGSYEVSFQAKDVYGMESAWSNTSETVKIVGRGDGNGDDDVNVADAVYMINYVFNSGPPPAPVSAGDANCDGDSNVADAVYLINYVFNSGPPPQCQ